MFRNPPEVNFRAVRNMGLAAWFGSSLMGLAGLRLGVGEAIDDPKERLRVVDAGWRGSRGLTAGAVTAYVLGVGLVRFNGNPFRSGFVPRWMLEGIENKWRAFLTAVALGSAITARDVRDRATDEMNSGLLRRSNKDEAMRLLNIEHALHGVVSAATAWLLYSHTKQDVKAETASTIPPVG